MILRYLYVGTSDTEREVAIWSELPGATLRWRFQNFGADVAAVDLGTAPVVLLADHRPSGSVLPIYAVDDLDESVAVMESDGLDGRGAIVRHTRGTGITARHERGCPRGAVAGRPARRDGCRVPPAPLDRVAESGHRQG
ncbi:MAG: hypothetical protein ACXV8L_12660 [Ilumatobacteraceae bacterium]